MKGERERESKRALKFGVKFCWGEGEPEEGVGVRVRVGERKSRLVTG